MSAFVPSAFRTENRLWETTPAQIFIRSRLMGWLPLDLCGERTVAHAPTL